MNKSFSRERKRLKSLDNYVIALRNLRMETYS